MENFINSLAKFIVISLILLVLALTTCGKSDEEVAQERQELEQKTSWSYGEAQKVTGVFGDPLPAVTGVTPVSILPTPDDAISELFWG